MSRALVKDLLMASSGYWVLNKKLVAMYGVETAFFLTSLAEAETYVTKGKGGWFYQTIETVENLTGLTRYKQDRALKELVDDGVVETDVRGMPAKRYMKLNYKRLHDKFVNLPQTSLQETHKQDCKKTTNKDAENLQTSLRVSYNNKELNKELKDKELSNKDILSGKPDRLGYDPEADEVPHKVGELKDYVDELESNVTVTLPVTESNATDKNRIDKNRIDKEKDTMSGKPDSLPYSEIINYLNKKADRQFKSTTKKTQSLIKARFNDGWEVEDFKIVIDKKTKEWLGDSKMENYLRPETLFGTKFESYLNQNMKVVDKEQGGSYAGIEF